LGDAPAHLMLRALGLDLGAGHEAKVRVPTAHFGTRGNGTLYAHVLVYRSTKQSLRPEGLAHPKVKP